MTKLFGTVWFVLLGQYDRHLMFNESRLYRTAFETSLPEQTLQFNFKSRFQFVVDLLQFIARSGLATFLLIEQTVLLC